MKNLRFWSVLLLLTFGMVEALSWVGLALLKNFKGITYSPVPIQALNKNQIESLQDQLNGQHKYLVYDSVLGWTHQPNGTSELGTLNRAGIRSQREYEEFPGPDKIRIAVFGDSFVHGDEVKTEETWQHLLESRNPQLEVLNFGVSGYGLDQAFLRYRELGVKFHPHIVLIGFVPLDTFRSVNAYRPFHSPETGIPLAKPRFQYQGDKLSLIPNSVGNVRDYEKIIRDDQFFLRSLGDNDFFYHRDYHSGRFDFLRVVRLAKLAAHQLKKRVEYRTEILVNDFYNPRSEAFEVTSRILQEFYNEVLVNKAIPIIVVFPSHHDLERAEKSDIPEYRYFLEFFKQFNMVYIDATEGFQNSGAVNWREYFRKIHYSPRGQEQMARHIHSFLESKRFLDAKKVADYLNYLDKLIENNYMRAQ